MKRTKARQEESDRIVGWPVSPLIRIENWCDFVNDSFNLEMLKNSFTLLKRARTLASKWIFLLRLSLHSFHVFWRPFLSFLFPFNHQSSNYKQRNPALASLVWTSLHLYLTPGVLATRQGDGNLEAKRTWFPLPPPASLNTVQFLPRGLGVEAVWAKDTASKCSCKYS